MARTKQTARANVEFLEQTSSSQPGNIEDGGSGLEFPSYSVQAPPSTAASSDTENLSSRPTAQEYPNVAFPNNDSYASYGAQAASFHSGVQSQAAQANVNFLHRTQPTRQYWSANLDFLASNYNSEVSQAYLGTQTRRANMQFLIQESAKRPSVEPDTSNSRPILKRPKPQNSQQTLEYPALSQNSPGSLRLMRIEPSPESHLGGDIYCTLVATPLWGEDIQYQCLSYCWGNSVKTNRIFIKTSLNPNAQYQPFSVTANLENCLQRLRDTKASQWLWIDAICINQLDVDERSAQVRVMREIYRNATGVIIWLGESSAELSLAVSVISSIATRFKTERFHRYEPIVNLGELSLSAEDIERLKTFTSVDVWGVSTREAYGFVANFFSLPWFRRVWVLQEAFSHGTITVRLGPHSLPWGSVILAALWQSFLVRSYSASKERDWATNHATQGYLPELWLSLLHTGTPTGLPMLELVCRARDFEASDPRDKVFALLGLANDLGDPTEHAIGLIPNYKKSSSEVYLAFTRSLIERTRNLDILAAVNTFSQRDFSCDVESWMPNLDVSVATIRGLGFPRKYNASSSTTINYDTFSRQSIPRALSLSGFAIDKVKSLSSVMSFSSDLRVVIDDNLDVVYTLWNTYVRPQCESSMEGSMLQSYIELLAAAGFALPANFHTHPLGKIVPSREVPSLIADFAAYWMLIEPSFASLHSPSQLRRYAAIGDADQFAVLAGKGCHERKFFLTDKGRMGLCPRDAESGDTVVILYGGTVPYILRVSGDEKWRFVGECYLDGMMFGEAKELKQRELINEEVFNIW